MYAVCRTAVRTAVFCVCGLLLTLALSLVNGSAVARAATLTNIYDFSDQFSLDDVEFEGLSVTDDGTLWIASMPDDGDPQLISVDLASLSVLTQATYSNAVTGDAFGGWLTSPFNPVALASDGTNLLVGSNGKSTYLYNYLYTTDSSGALADDPIQFAGSVCNDPEGAASLDGVLYVTCEESDTVVMLNSDGSVDELLSGFTALGLAATDSALIIGDYDTHELILYDLASGEESERIDLAELFPDYEVVDIDGNTHTVPDPDGLAYWDGKIYMSFEFDLRVFEISLDATPTPTPTPTPTATPTATPTPAPDPITFTKAGDGRGAILVNDDVVCDPECTETQVPYVEGETLTIDATPESNSTFDGWLINGETVSGAATIVSGDTVTAIFALIAAPTADFTASPLRGYAPLTVTVRSTSQGDIDSTTWDFGDGGSADEDPAGHSYESAGTYDVSLTVENGGGSDTLTQSGLIEVLEDNAAPIVTISLPDGQSAVGSGSLQVSGTIADDGELVEVLVNEVAATVSGDAENGYSFTAAIDLENGNQILSVSAEDDGGAFGFAERLVRVDGEGPEIDIESPRSGTAVDSLTPSLAISFSDFLSEVDPDSVEISLTDADGTSTDLSGELTIAASGASGTLDEALNEDSSYTLTVTVSDSLGNSRQASSLFYVPLDPDDIVAPEEAEDAGWITGTVYDSSTCNEHLSTCSGLTGARVTVAYGSESGEEVAGTIVTGPEGDFQFPVSETNIYWLRVEKDDYSYGQREVEVVRDRATATTDIYLTPLDTNVSYCDSTGCSHESADGLMQECAIPYSVLLVEDETFWRGPGLRSADRGLCGPYGLRGARRDAGDRRPDRQSLWGRLGAGRTAAALRG